MVEPRERTGVPICRWNFNKNEFESVGNLIYFENEDDLFLSQFFTMLSVEKKNEIYEKVGNALAIGKLPSTVMKEEIKKKYDERKEKNMLLTNTINTVNTIANTTNSETCLQSGCINATTAKQEKPCFCYTSMPRGGLFGGNPVINGVAFGSNDEVYLMICDQRCEIYPRDGSNRVEVELIRNLDIQEFMKTYQEKNEKRIPGGKINRLQKALAKWRRMLTPFSTKQFKGPAFDKIVFSGNATILIDTYGKKKKTVVKCQEGEPYDPEKALLTALFIREYGKNAYHDLMDICHDTYVECGESNKPKSKKKTAKKAVSKTKNR